MPVPPLTADRIRCLQPRLRSVVCTETCPKRNWMCSNRLPRRGRAEHKSDDYAVIGIAAQIVRRQFGETNSFRGFLHNAPRLPNLRG